MNNDFSRFSSMLSRASVVCALSIMLAMPTVSSKAAEQTTVTNLPERIFDLSHGQFNGLVTAIVNAYADVHETDQSLETLQKINRLLALVMQFEDYKAAMESLSYVEGNEVYADVKSATTRLAKEGVTAERLAVRGTKLLVSFNDWQSLDNIAFEKRQVTLANFLLAIREPALAARANLDFAQLYGTLSKKQVMLDRFKAAIDESKKVTDFDRRNAFEVELSAKVAALDDQRKFGLLTMLLRGTESKEQQGIIETVSRTGLETEKGESRPKSVSPDQSSKLSLAWKTRLLLEQKKLPVQAWTDIVRQHLEDIDTSALVVLLSGSLGRHREEIAGEMVGAYLARGLELRAYNFLKSLPKDVFSLDHHLKLADQLASSDYKQFSEDMLDTIRRFVKSNPTATLSSEQQLAMISTLVRNGDVAALQQELEDGLLAGGQFDKTRLLLKSRIESMLSRGNNTGETPQAVAKFDLPSLGNGDLNALLQLINGQLPDETLYNESPTKDATALWVRAGSQLWKQRPRRQAIVDFVRSAAPITWKAAMIDGAISNWQFDPAQDDGKQLVAAIHQSGILNDLSQQSRNTIKPSSTAEPPEFNERIKTISDIESYAARVVAFRRLAKQNAQMLDASNWLTPTLQTPATDKDVTSANTILETDVAKEEVASAVSLKSTDSALLQAAPKKPRMPDFDVDSDSVYSLIPMVEHGELGTTVGGETRIERLTRFASEYYRDISNLGVRDHIYLSNATITPKFIFLRSGVVSMDQLLSSIAPFNPELVSEAAGIVLLRAPIVVGPDATLILSGKEFSELRLSKQKGAFIINAGKVYFSDISITGYDEQKNAPATVYKGEEGHDFRPFFLSWSGSQTFAANSKFEAMGYPAGRAYGFSMSSGPADDISAASNPSAPTGLIINNAFVNLYYGFYAYEVNSAQLIGNEYRDGIVYGIDPHDRSTDLVIAYNSTYGTHKKHGIIISREVDDSFIVGNLSFGNAGSGIMLDRESVGTVVYANSIFDNKGDGFAAFESPCALFSSNYVAGNSRVGIKVRNSWDVQIEGNIIRSNGVSGVEGYIDRLEASKGSAGRNYVQDPYSPVTTLTVVRNVFEGNPAGLVLRGASAATIFNNSFVKQAPKLFAGDASSFAVGILAKGHDAPVTVVADCIPKISKRKACTLAQQGVIIDHSNNRDFADSGADPGYCLNKAGSIQANALQSVK